jgi:hypothetical protein
LRKCARRGVKSRQRPERKKYKKSENAAWGNKSKKKQAQAHYCKLNII